MRLAFAKISWLGSVMLSFALLAGAFGCAKAEPERQESVSANQAAEPSPTVSPETKRAALVSLSAAHHKKADLALHSDDSGTAINEMNQLLGACEQSTLDSPETFDVAFDAATRLSKLHLDRGEVEEAERAARRGLKLDKDAPPSLFKGYLHQTLGDVLEEKKDLKGAVDEHSEAIRIFRALLELRGPGTETGK